MEIYREEQKGNKIFRLVSGFFATKILVYEGEQLIGWSHLFKSLEKSLINL